MQNAGTAGIVKKESGGTQSRAAFLNSSGEKVFQMYQIEVDPHTHSVISLHAYSTVEECARHAAERGLRGIAVTDHCSRVMAQQDNSVEAILNQKVLPDRIGGVRVWKGVEIDIVDYEGHLAFEDVPDRFRPGVTGAQVLLPTRDVVIASVHTPFDRDESREDVEKNTRMYCAVLENPYVNILGHTGRANHPYELRPVLETAKRLHKMIEINSASLSTYAERAGKACRSIAEMCRDLGVKITVSSDAHSAFQVGEFRAAIAMLESIGFPQSLIANRTVESFEAALAESRRI